MKIVEVPEPVLQRQSPARERRVEELKKLQTHDPDVVPMQGGRYGKIIKNDRGQFVSIQPIEQPVESSSSQLEQLVAETTLEAMSYTRRLIPHPQVNPAVRCPHQYSTRRQSHEVYQ